MAKLHTLVEEFPGTTLDASKWTTAGSSSTSLVISGGEAQLRLSSTSSTRERSITSVDTFDATGSQILIEHSQVVNGQWALSMLRLTNSTSNTNNIIDLYHSAGWLYADGKSGGVSLGTTVFSTTPYSPVAHKYWRLRLPDATTVIAGRSADGTTWEEFGSITVSGPLDLTTARVQLFAGAYPPATTSERFTVQGVNHLVVTPPPSISGVVTLLGSVRQGVFVRLIRLSDNVVVATTTTDSSGFYAFQSVPAGVYDVVFSQSSGGNDYVQGALNVTVS
jgi:hypothetical protein